MGGAESGLNTPTRKIIPEVENCYVISTFAREDLRDADG